MQVEKSHSYRQNARILGKRLVFPNVEVERFLGIPITEKIDLGYSKLLAVSIDERYLMLLAGNCVMDEGVTARFGLNFISPQAIEKTIENLRAGSAQAQEILKDFYRVVEEGEMIHDRAKIDDTVNKLNPQINESRIVDASDEVLLFFRIGKWSYYPHAIEMYKKGSEYQAMHTFFSRLELLYPVNINEGLEFEARSGMTVSFESNPPEITLPPSLYLKLDVRQSLRPRWLAMKVSGEIQIDPTMVPKLEGKLSQLL